MSKVIVIHPIDPSTSFLDEITQHILTEFSGAALLIKPTIENSTSFVEAIINSKYEDDDIIIFLGHGRSDGLYGAIDSKGNKNLLFNRVDVRRILSRKNAI